MALLQHYRELIKNREIVEDSSQREALARLQDLLERLRDYAPPGRTAGWLPFRRSARRPPEPPRGLYIWGDVGRGKSMLMDLFYRHLPLESKRRVHFHAFMAEAHAQLHAWRQSRKEDLREADPIPPLARSIAARGRVLCLDEFQVTDVADAVILARLFGELIARGVVVVATSNRPPESLYTEGLQREYFFKFVDLARARWDILELAGPQDHRLRHLQSMRCVYFTPLGREAEAFLESAFGSLTCHAERERMELPVGGRKLAISGHGDVAWSSFGELCGQPLGAADYLEIAREFHTLILSGIPAMPPEMRNEAARFVKLIDALYDRRVKLICSAAAPPEQLYPKGDTAFEFQRTASRLAEMQSEQYFAASHIA